VCVCVCGVFNDPPTDRVVDSGTQIHQDIHN